MAQFSERNQILLYWPFTDRHLARRTRFVIPNPSLSISVVETVFFSAPIRFVFVPICVSEKDRNSILSCLYKVIS